ncbi:class II glutamine amidotransferase [candidate division KSB1 bacterium]
MSRLFGMICKEKVNLSCSQLDDFPSGYDPDIYKDNVIDYSDGWGIGFFKNTASFLYKKTSKDTGQKRITSISEVVSSHIFLSHLRIATIGEKKEANTQPFRWGNWLFAHIGTVHRFRKLRSRLMRKLPSVYKRNISGNTDSEVLFYYYLSLLRQEGSIKKGDIPFDAAVKVMKEFSVNMQEFLTDSEITEVPELNFIITNGSYMLATSLDKPLYYLTIQSEEDSDIRFFSPTSMLEYQLIQTEFPNKIIVVSSEKLTRSDDWIEVNNNNFLGINSELDIELHNWF